MHVLITGGTGFIGKEIARALVQLNELALEGQAPQRIERIVLFDPFLGEAVPEDSRIEVIKGDLDDRQLLSEACKNVDLVWHLAAVVSSAAEADFDLGMSVNIHGFLNLLEILRHSGTRPRLVYASGFAVFGGELPEVVTDATLPTPQSSYGIQKLIGELLVTDYHRKGFIDGRVLRLPTIAVRPGKPNKAASTFVSSIIREPVAGMTANCPVRPDTLVYLASPRIALAAMLHAMKLSSERLGVQRVIPLPGLTISVAEMVSALERVAGQQASTFINWDYDETIQRIVESWPSHVKAERAQYLGFEQDVDFESIVRAHVEN